MSRMSYHKTIKYLPQIIEQTGKDCFFCKCVGTMEKPLENGHLRGRKYGDRPENLARMCHSCNMKMENDFDMIDQAKEQFKLNQNRQYEREKTKTTSCLESDELSPSAIMKINRPTTKLYLTEHTMNTAVILLSVATNSTTALCNDNNGTGSQQAIRRYIEVLCSGDDSKFEIFRETDGRLYIKRREN